MRERIRRANARETLGSRWRQFKWRTMCMCVDIEWHKGSNSPPSTRSGMPSQSPSNNYFGKYDPRTFLPNNMWYDDMWWGIPLISLGQLSCQWPLTILCLPFSLLAGREWKSSGKTEKVLLLCKHCSEIAEILVCYCYYFDYKSKTQYHMGCCEENSSQPHQVYSPVVVLSAVSWTVLIASCLIYNLLTAALKFFLNLYHVATCQ